MFCKCGCGRETKTASRNRKETGWKKGVSLAYIHGHNGRIKNFTPKIKQMLIFYKEGMSSSEISEKMDIPKGIVKYRLKLNGALRSRLEAMKLAREQGKWHYVGNNHPMSEETKEKLSLSLKAKGIKPKQIYSAFGEKHWNWKGGITSETSKLRQKDEYKNWRDSIYRRDCWTCGICKVKGGKITAHHLKSFTDFPELRFEVSNGITLCRSCHIKIHCGNGGWQRGSRLYHDLKNPRTEVTVIW